MEQKKNNYKKIIIILIIFLVIIIGVFIFKDFIILKSLDSKFSNIKENQKNIYIKMVSDTAEMEIFLKDDTIKNILTSIDDSKKITEFSKPKIQKTFVDTDESKELHIFEDEEFEPDNTDYIGFNYDFINSDNFFDNLSNSLKIKIKKVDVEGIKCYKLTNFSGEDDKSIAYINVETGFPVEINDEKEESKITYEVKFDCVTDKDIEEPDNSNYTIVESDVEE